MASISSYCLTLWLRVNWVTPTPSVFTVIVAGFCLGTHKIVQSGSQEKKNKKQRKPEDKVLCLHFLYIQIDIYSGHCVSSDLTDV